MGLSEWIVDDDHFEPRPKEVFVFPCYACRNVDNDPSDEPCLTCGHNLASIKKEPEPCKSTA